MPRLPNFSEESCCGTLRSYAVPASYSLSYSKSVSGELYSYNERLQKYRFPYLVADVYLHDRWAPVTTARETRKKWNHINQHSIKVFERKSKTIFSWKAINEVHKKNSCGWNKCTLTQKMLETTRNAWIGHVTPVYTPHLAFTIFIRTQWHNAIKSNLSNQEVVQSKNQYWNSSSCNFRTKQVKEFTTGCNCLLQALYIW